MMDKRIAVRARRARLLGGMGAAALLIGGACPVPSAQAAPQPPAAEQADYRLRAGDQIEIVVFRQPALGQRLTIAPDGKISLLFVGEVKASGMTLRELTQSLTKALAKEVDSPQVSINLTGRKPFEVNVLGAVARPGRRTTTETWRLLDLLAEVGGISAQRPEWVKASVVHADGSVTPVDMAALLRDASSAQNLTLAHGDTLLVIDKDPNAVSIQVLGEVTRPGVIAAPVDKSMATVISAAGGFSTRATLTKVVLMRGPESYTLDLSAYLQQGKLKARDGRNQLVDNLEILPGDIIIVPRNRQLFTVMGAVGRPGPIDFPDDEPMPLTKALSLAGGVGANANLKKSYLVRTSSAGTPDIQPLNLEELLKGKGGPAKDIVLQPSDVVYIESNGAPRQRFGIFEASTLIALLLNLRRL
jgi:polysaccharide biosynthesis/export protein